MTVTMATGGAGKKTFEFRMSKKVAELTQVVHMLFTRNHEKEVELEALKGVYEEEIANVISDAQQKIEKLEQNAREADQLHRAASERMKAEAVKGQEALKQRLVKTEQELAEEKRECQSARDLLIAAQNDIERLRRGQGEEVGRMKEDHESRLHELSQLRQRIQALEKSLREKDSQLSTSTNLSTMHENLQKEIVRLKQAAESAEKAKEEYATRNNQLESDIKQLKRELAKRQSERNANSAKSRAPPEPVAPTLSSDQSEELDRLRKEVLRYRMELTNRESNFNRMFTEKQPVFVDKRRKSGARGQGSTMIADGLAQLRYTREKSVYEPRVIENFQDQVQYTELQEPSPRSSVLFTNQMTNGRLPHLSGEHVVSGASSPLPMSRGGPRILVKPKPLPKELISAKTPTGHA